MRNSPCININPLTITPLPVTLFPVTPLPVTSFPVTSFPVTPLALRSGGVSGRSHKRVPYDTGATFAQCNVLKKHFEVSCDQNSHEGRFAQMYFQLTRQTFAGATLQAAGVAHFCTTSPTMRKGQNLQNDSALQKDFTRVHHQTSWCTTKQAGE
jgi:hypothetical protein